MAEKLAQYTGSIHLLRGRARDAWQGLIEVAPKEKLKNIQEETNEKIRKLKEKAIINLNKGDGNDYSHIFRKKTRNELVRVSAAVMGIEFAYAAETAFVSPTLLEIGVPHRKMTLIWCLSPLVGFFLTPILGSFSDKCKSKLGRRRPFIILLSIGIILGLILVPNGRILGRMFGDSYTPLKISPDVLNETVVEDMEDWSNGSYSGSENSNSWGIFFTILGTVLLDFDADACQSPSRAYLLDVCLPEDHALGLSTFTIMAGLGGSLGYAMGGVNWDSTFIGYIFGGHVRAVFTIITAIFITCVLSTLYSFQEIPLDDLNDAAEENMQGEKQQYTKLSAEDGLLSEDTKTYGSTKDTCKVADINGIVTDGFVTKCEEDSSLQQIEEVPPDGGVLSEEAENVREGHISFKEYMLSILYMPGSMRILCLTNLFCWMSLVCYSLYFTDFVGEAVFNGDPSAPEGSTKHTLYEEGVRFGCWGMAMYSLSCSLYSCIIEKLVKRFKAKSVYMGGQLVYSLGMVLMAATRHKAGVIIFSCSAGIMYSTLFTMPYILVAHYHANQVFSVSTQGERQGDIYIRGLGTDVAVVSSMVFLAQFLLSTFMGSIIAAVGSTTVVVIAASVLSFCGSLSASQVMYLDL
ncbi:proton-associated sugar transporter A-like [Artemia franciscana]|uniref:Proton-associated sugar transporter A n=1 Tax=Artemia franciscana TaxID=6661 RepID=A0AA88L5F9_ARTSF|nr:hypothetical protein QYM36_009470 [Artemia franciscana]